MFAAISLACLAVSALCVSASVAIYKWDRRQEHKYKIELANSHQYSWEEFDMINKEKFESNYWRVAEDGKGTART
tara:strand:+ start:821 stop:1045 length:225 start_codon:yes stop_codon:yes gene_type:complete